MEIRNTIPSTQPNFGMAFVRPNTESMAQLTEYLTKKATINSAAEGLREIIAEQAKNRHYNIEYVANRNAFKVVPVSQEAKKFTPAPRVFETSEKLKTKREKLKEAVNSSDDVLKNNGYSRFGIFRYKLNNRIKLFVEQLRLLTHPQRELPSNLQEAVSYANKNSDKIEQSIYNNERISSLFGVDLPAKKIADKFPQK